MDTAHHSDRRLPGGSNCNRRAFTLESPAAERTANQEPTPRLRHADSGEPPTALVIGAGLGGLSAGIHLARQGWRVSILERNHRSGGRMNQIQEQGFRIDMGPTMLMMPEVVENLFAQCGRDYRDYLEWERIAPAYRIIWEDGTTLDMGASAEEMLERVRVFAPEDAARFPAFIAAMKKKYFNARFNFIERSFNNLSALLSPTTLKGLAQSLPYESVYKFVSRYIKNERLRQAFTFQTLYLGISPYDCPSIYALLPYIEMEFGVWFPKGGTIAVADALERLFYELGGEIHYHTPVERILVQEGRAMGVRTAEERNFYADAVVSNMDVSMTYKRLLPPEQRRKYTDARLDRLDYGCSGYLLYLGVKRIPSDWTHNTILMSDQYRAILDDICINKKAPRDPAMHVCIPTRTDPSLAPEGHDVIYVLAPCPNTQGEIDWETEGPALRERMLAKLERTGLPGLRENIVYERSFAPPEFESLYGCYAGSAYGGLSHTFMQSAYFRPHSRSEDVQGLYFVGASTHPGGGVPIVLTCGRLVADEIAATIRK